MKAYNSSIEPMKLTWIEVKQWAALIALDTSTEPNLYKLNKQLQV